ncbi:hypothetical protein H6501_04025 [Candidatus Woesearchaeota archaeon]|nr:hypothetical protein [Nanoarchaeota archaeon]MCB9370740.1 hypothetical protein [Candidatus Woesearchaeota archaeon]USN43815.1 MAG: hypothetical protein H6500_05495 [Candidatus Woesearchaeota archaeon]
MDDTIKIIVSLVVILAVGFTMIAVSSDILANSKRTVDRVPGAVGSEDKLLNEDFDNEQIGILVKQCYDNNYGIKNSDLCYIVNNKGSTNLAQSYFPADFLEGASIVVEPSPLTEKTFYIRYSSIGGDAIITVSADAE